MMRDEAAADSFIEFVQRVEPQLRNALIPILGLDAARDAATDALTHGWEHWDRVCWMATLPLTCTGWLSPPTDPSQARW